MTARVLVVDDVAANLKLLEARLTAEYYEVLTARSGQEALELCAREDCDVILLDVMMPEMDGFEVCRRLKADPETAHIPVIILTALDQPRDKLAGLRAGADDFLTKPVNDIGLLTRVRSLSRLKVLTDELRVRAATGKKLGMSNVMARPQDIDSENGRVLLVDTPGPFVDALAVKLRRRHQCFIEADPQAALIRAADEDFELMIVNLAQGSFDPLRLCSQLRALERTRLLPILLVASPDDDPKLLRGLDLGANDYIRRPVDENELAARVRTQIRRKRYNDLLRRGIRESMEMAVTDSLTGLHNRRYMENHLENLILQARPRGKDLTLMILDIDHFKAVNDTYGHGAGDDVLKEFAHRIAENTRGLDLVCRLGGEEFVIVMPDTDLSFANHVAERLRKRIAETEFVIDEGSRHCTVTVSIGIAALEGAKDSVSELLSRADEALYRAKRDGRNRVVSHAA